MTVKSRVCKVCGIEKTAEHYHKEHRSPDGLHAQCKSCRSAKTKFNKYGLDPNKYEEMVKATPHCPICGSEEPLVVDHDHSTGKVRGLICQPCNKALGFFRDNTTSMQNAIKYLDNEPL